MSTITKLNPLVRLRRAARRDVIREFERDAKIFKPMNVQAALLAHMNACVLHGIRKSSYRTGVMKDRIFDKLLKPKQLKLYNSGDLAL